MIWTAEARANLIAVHDYIGQFSPLNAQRFSLRLIKAVESLAEFPERGRPVSGGRDYTAIWPYIVRYRVTTGEIIILRIRHGDQSSQ
ncbi:MAG: type II toxin-antitoxin system RelE/ParE family toxin [Caulobacteraceae bacterium]